MQSFRGTLWHLPCRFNTCILLIVLSWGIKRRHTNIVLNSNTVAAEEKLGDLGKKRMSSKHLWSTNRDAKDSHLCLQNHLLSLSVSVSLVLTLIHCSFFTYAPFVPHKIQAWQLRTLGPFGWNICSAFAAFYKSADPRWEQLKQREVVALNKAPIWAAVTGRGFSWLMPSSKHADSVFEQCGFAAVLTCCMVSRHVFCRNSWCYFY